MLINRILKNETEMYDRSERGNPPSSKNLLNPGCQYWQREVSCIPICPNCGRATPEGKFCEHCGASLAVVQAYAPPQQQQQQVQQEKGWGGTVAVICCIILIILFIIGYVSSL